MITPLSIFVARNIAQNVLICVILVWGDFCMTRSQLEKKVKHLRKEIEYFSRVFPKSEKIKVLKSSYRHYSKLTK